MQAPHDQAPHPGGPGLQHRQVAHAGLVHAAAVVDDQHVAGFSQAESLQEHIHAAVVPHRQDPPSDPLAGHDRPDSRMGGPQRNTTAHARISHQRSGQIRERLQHGDLPSPVSGTADSARPGNDPAAARDNGYLRHPTARSHSM